MAPCSLPKRSVHRWEPMSNTAPYSQETAAKLANASDRLAQCWVQSAGFPVRQQVSKFGEPGAVRLLVRLEPRYFALQSRTTSLQEVAEVCIIIGVEKLRQKIANIVSLVAKDVDLHRNHHRAGFPVGQRSDNGKE